MRLFADTNIPAPVVGGLREDGHDVVHSAEWPEDPGDHELLRQAVHESRVFITKDTDLGTLVFRDQSPHAGILLIDDLANPMRELELVRDALSLHGTDLEAHAFLRATAGGLRIAHADQP